MFIVLLLVKLVAGRGVEDLGAGVSAKEIWVVRIWGWSERGGRLTWPNTPPRPSSGLFRTKSSALLAGFRGGGRQFGNKNDLRFRAFPHKTTDWLTERIATRQ